MKITGQTVVLEKDDKDFLLELGRQQGTSRILPASSMAHLIEQFRPPLGDGLSLPWPEMRSVRFMPGKVSIWSGPSFAGKTSFLRQLMLHAIHNCNQRALVISLEEEPDEVWREFTSMAATSRDPNKHQRAWASDHFENKLWVFDSTEMLDPMVLLGTVRFAVERFGFSHVVIDSLMRLALAADDYEGQRQLGNMLGRLAKTSKAHIHLVAHPRKTSNSREPMDMYDIRGTGDIVAQADLVLTLERRHKAAQHEPTNNLTIWKQRGDCNWIGEIPLYYCPSSRQLKLRQSDFPMRFLPPNAFEGIVQPIREDDFFPDEVVG